jgi:hypothetical protein
MLHSVVSQKSTDVSEVLIPVSAHPRRQSPAKDEHAYTMKANKKKTCSTFDVLERNATMNKHVPRSMLSLIHS